MDDLLASDIKPSDVKEALKDGVSKKTSLVKVIKDKAEKFIDQREILAKINEPMKLADNAKSNLEALQESLRQTLPKHPDRNATLKSVKKALSEIVKLAKSCHAQLHKKHS